MKALSLLFAAILLISCQTEENTEAKPKEENLLDAVFVRQYVNMPYRLFDDAVKHLQNGRDDLASRRLNKAASYIEITANNAAPEKKEALQKSAEVLRNLSKRITSGEVPSKEEFNKAFGDTILAIAENTKARAQVYLPVENQD